MTNQLRAMIPMVIHDSTHPITMNGLDYVIMRQNESYVNLTQSEHTKNDRRLMVSRRWYHFENLDWCFKWKFMIKEGERRSWTHYNEAWVTSIGHAYEWQLLDMKCKWTWSSDCIFTKVIIHKVQCMIVLANMHNSHTNYTWKIPIQTDKSFSQ
jgi:hypothetical protein